jgi:hypothetical protein
MWKCLNLECEEYSCKSLPPNNNADACCLANLLSFQMVDCVNTFKCLTQCCCFEIVCGCPLDEAYVDGAIDTDSYGAVDTNYLYPWS